MDYIFIDVDKEIKKIGMIKDDELTEFLIQENDEIGSYQNIYRARVVNVIPGINAAFVDIGEDKNAYLSARDALDLEDFKMNSDLNIEEILKPGDEILVQIEKEAHNDKGAKVSRHMELAGDYIIFTPYFSRVNVSRKIKDHKRREELLQLGRSIIEDNQGMIIRTICEDVEDEIIYQEYRRLKRLYIFIKSQKNFLPTPKLIYKPLDKWEEFIYNNHDKVDQIIINNNNEKDELVENLANLDISIIDKIRFDESYASKYDKLANDGIMKALDRRVELINGGLIIIDTTEAMTIIDVDTSSFIGNLSKDETVLETNLEAVKEISKQIKLRNISGIILIDFINMKKENENKVINRLRTELNKDGVKSNIMGMTRLGILELTRERTSRSLEDILMKKCHKCHGTGKIRE